MQPGLASLLDHYGQSVLHIAASKGHVHTLQLLLKMCYTTHTCTDTSKCGILILPSRAGNVGVRSRDREGFSVIDVAEGVEGEEEGEVEGRSDAEAVRDILLKHEMLQLGGTEC